MSKAAGVRGLGFRIFTPLRRRTPLADQLSCRTSSRLDHPIVADGLGRTALPGFVSQRDFFERDWLTIDNGESGLFVPPEEVGHRIAAQIAVSTG